MATESVRATITKWRVGPTGRPKADKTNAMCHGCLVPFFQFVANAAGDPLFSAHALMVSLLVVDSLQDRTHDFVYRLWPDKAILRVKWDQQSKPEDIELQYNPTELSWDKSAQIAEITIPGLDAPLQKTSKSICSLRVPSMVVSASSSSKV
jgi:hypothetical protein